MPLEATLTSDEHPVIGCAVRTLERAALLPFVVAGAWSMLVSSPMWLYLGHDRPDGTVTAQSLSRRQRQHETAL